jgi:hypothetical protein
MQRKPSAREPLNWDDVRLFLVLSRAGTLGEAAARLRVDASTASRRLVQLEQALAVTLFARGRNGIAMLLSGAGPEEQDEPCSDAYLRPTVQLIVALAQGRSPPSTERSTGRHCIRTVAYGK